MRAIASQITSLTMIYLTVYSGADQRKHKSSASLALGGGGGGGGGEGDSPVTGEFYAQRTSNAENVSIWWRHHVSGNLVTHYEWGYLAEKRYQIHR